MTDSARHPLAVRWSFATWTVQSLVNNCVTDLTNLWELRGIETQQARPRDFVWPICDALFRVQCQTSWRRIHAVLHATLAGIDLPIACEVKQLSSGGRRFGHDSDLRRTSMPWTSTEPLEGPGRMDAGSEYTFGGR